MKVYIDLEVLRRFHPNEDLPVVSGKIIDKEQDEGNSYWYNIVLDKPYRLGQRSSLDFLGGSIYIDKELTLPVSKLYLESVPFKKYEGMWM